MATTTCIKKLRELRDGIQTSIDILDAIGLEADDLKLYLQQLFVDTDLAIDKPCGCKD